MHFLHRVIVLCLVTLGIALVAGAQGLTSRFDGPRVTNLGEPIPLGPLLFSPSLQLTWQHRDNIFFTPVEPVADEIYLARAAFVFRLPIHQSHIQLAYRPVYRDYKEFELTQNWSHFLDLSGGFEFASGLVARVQYRYVDGSQETREVDPGDELVFGDRPFIKNSLGLGLDYWITARDGVRVEGDFIDVAYDDSLTLPPPEDPGESSFYDYSRSHFGAGWLHQINSVMVMDLLYGRSEFEPEGTFAWRTSTSDQVTVGLKGQLSAVLSTELRVGWRMTQYGTFEGEQVVDDFSGFIVQGDVNWALGHGSTVRLGLRRSDHPSNYEVNPYYVTTGADLEYSFDRGRFFSAAGARYQVNSYPVADFDTGEKRKDQINDLGLLVGYRLTSILSLYGSYLWEDRDSNVGRLGYTTNIYSIGVTIGIGS
jgi:hypothetical protein